MTATVTEDRAAAYARTGYHVARGVLDRAEVEHIQETFMRRFPAMAVSGRGGTGEAPDAYPRVLHPHRSVPLARDYLLDGRIVDVVEELLGEQALAAQSMFYFKPPGARGQAFHQDNFYLRVQPGTCIAAWIPAADRTDDGNGGLHLVPGSHRMDIACPEQADEQDSFSPDLVRPPADLQAVPAILEPGDVLFFHGNLIHGSGPNRSADRFRRSLIFHYIPLSAREVAQFYEVELLDRRGRAVGRDHASGGGPCGPAQESPH